MTQPLRVSMDFSSTQLPMSIDQDRDSFGQSSGIHRKQRRKHQQKGATYGAFNDLLGCDKQSSDDKDCHLRHFKLGCRPMRCKKCA
jgi:hypothetical protein